MSQIESLAGVVLDNQYELIELLGKGGMASVYRARQTSVNRIVAVKVLPHSLLHEETFMQRFRQEAEVIARLEHFHILPIYDYGEYNGMPYIVMRYLDGGTLQQRIERGPMEWEDILRIIRQIGGALDYAHARNVIHRDIKPSNIMLDADGNAYLLDFGIAKMTESTAQLTGSGIVGTPSYMAPEQSQPGPPAPSMDVYALGVTLFEMITGHVPFMADTPIAQIMMHLQSPVPSLRESNPTIPPAIDEVVQRAMAKDPAERYASGSELARALETAVNSAGGWDTSATIVSSERGAVPVTPPGLRQPAAPAQPAARRRRGWLIPVLGIGALGLVGVAVLAVVLALNLGQSLGGDNGSESPAVAAPSTPVEAAVVADEPTPEGGPAAGQEQGQEQEPTPEPTVEPTPEEEPAGEPTPSVLEPRIVLRGVPMVLVPAGPFIMGNNNGYPRERPEHEVVLDAFYIDETEVTNLYYMACVDAGGCEAPEFVNSPSQVAYYGLEFYHNYPLIYATWEEAQNYCRWRGGHLPTEAQWEKAARWDPETGEVRLFPWGGPSLDPYYLNYESNLGRTVTVGTYEPGKSAVGAYEMAGNLAEWVYDWFQDNYYEQSPAENPTGPESGQFRVIRGGSYESRGSALMTTFRDYIHPLTQSPTIGVRCAFTPSGDPTR